MSVRVDVLDWTARSCSPEDEPADDRVGVIAGVLGVRSRVFLPVLGGACVVANSADLHAGGGISLRGKEQAFFVVEIRTEMALGPANG